MKTSLWGNLGQEAVWLEKFPLCHSFSNGSAVCKFQSPLWSPPTPLTQRGSWCPGGLADAFPGAGQLGRRAQGSGESLYPWWLLYAGRVTAPGPLPQLQDSSSLGWRGRSGDCRRLCDASYVPEVWSGLSIISAYGRSRAGIYLKTVFRSD